MRSTWLSVLVLTVLAAGCADETAILLEIDSTNLVIPTDVDQLRIRAEGLETGRATDRLFTPTEWPESLSIVPGEGSNREQVQITVWGLSGGMERIKRIVRSSFTPDTTTDLRIVLDRDCLDVMCAGDDNFCLGGDCVSVMPPDGGMDMGPPDMGVDPMDLGMDVDGGGDEDDLGMDPVDMGMDPVDMFMAPDMPPATGYTGLIISEYVEGDGDNKAIEIFNGTGGLLDGADCDLVLYRNGGAEGGRFGVDTTLAANQTWVFCHTNLSDTSACDSIESTLLNHNGDDAYAIECDGMIIDSLGDMNGDPGTAWSGGGLSTAQDTLRRVCPGTPDTDLSDDYDPSGEWVSAGVNNVSGLGMRACPGSP